MSAITQIRVKLEFGLIREMFRMYGLLIEPIMIRAV